MCDCAGLVTTPLDVLKTRLMTQGASGTYRNLFDATATILRTEGAGAFMSGWQPRLIWISLGGLVFFPVLEATKEVSTPWQSDSAQCDVVSTSSCVCGICTTCKCDRRICDSETRTWMDPAHECFGSGSVTQRCRVLALCCTGNRAVFCMCHNCDSKQELFMRMLVTSCTRGQYGSCGKRCDLDAAIC